MTTRVDRSAVDLENLSKLLNRPVALTSLPTTSRYPPAVLTREVVKAVLGLGLCVGVLVALRPTPWVGWPLAGVALMFALYLQQQTRRFFVQVRVDDGGVVRTGATGQQAIRWSELKDLRLNYYPNGRKAQTGTLMLVLKGERKRIKVDSALEEFGTLLARAAQAARERELELHPTTQANLAQLGL